MNRWLLAASAAVLALGSAQAADMGMPARMPVKAPLAQLAYNWTGFYLGAYIGHGVNNTRGSDPTGLLSGQFDYLGVGIHAGGTVGFNWQFNNWLAGGLEGDFGALGVSRATTNWNEVIGYNSKSNWLATARARIGLLGNGTFGYVTGGAAAVDVEDVVTTPFGSASSRGTRFGYVLGGGKEVALSGGWTAKIEQLYVDVAAGGTVNPVGPINVQAGRHKYYLNRFGVNYAFGGKNFVPTPGNWGGFYVGLIGGDAITDTAATETAAFVPGSVFSNNETAYHIGGIAGFNWQSGHLVLGPEGDVSWFGLSRSRSDFNDPSAVLSTKTKWFASARGRAGVSVGDALLYATAGWGWAGVDESWQRFTGASIDSLSKTTSGLTFGGGIESKFWGPLVARAEYLYFDGGKTSLTSVLGVGGTSTLSVDHKYHLFRSGLTYRFGDNAVVARY